MATPDIYIDPTKGTIGLTGSVTGTIQLRVAESGAIHFEGDQGSLLTITDDLSDSLFSVNDAAGMPVFEVFADDTIKSYRNNETKLEIDPDNNRIRLRDNTYISGDLIVSGDITSTSASHESTSYTASTHVSGLSGYFGKVGIGTTSILAPTATLSITDNSNTVYGSDLDVVADTVFINAPKTDNSDNQIGASIAFGLAYGGYGLYRGASIAAVQTNADVNVMGLSFYTSASTSTNNTVAEAMRIEGDGKVAIGTNNPTALLTVDGDASITGELKVGGHINLPVGLSLQWGNSHERIESTDGTIKFLTNNGLQAIMSGSSVGIGTNFPNSRLHVVGNYNYFDTLDDTTANNIYFRDNSKNLRGQLEFSMAGKQSQLVTRTNSHLRIGTNNAGYIHIDRDGLVGIGGTGQPGAVLTSHGDTSISGELRTAANVGINAAPIGRLHVYQSGDSQPALLVEGSQGSLFSVEDSLTGSLMSVNDIAGLPVFEAFDDGTIVMGQYNSGDLVVSGNNVWALSRVGIGISPAAATDDTFSRLDIANQAVGAGSTFAWALDITRPGSPTSRGLLFGHNSSNTPAIAAHNADLQLGHHYSTDGGGSPVFYPDLTIAHKDQAVGGVGIGTSVVDGSRLRVKGDVGISGHLRGNEGAWFNGNSNGNNTLKFTNTAGTDNHWSMFANYNDQTFRILGDSTTVMTLEDAGNVGIGVTDPDAALDIRRTENTVFAANTQYQAANGATQYIYNLSSTTNSFAQLVLLNRNSSAGGVRLASLSQGANASDFVITTEDSTASAERMRITSAGKVGIGTTGPSFQLSVEAQGNDDGYLLTNTAGTTLAQLHQEDSDAGRLMLKDGGAGKISLNADANQPSYFNNGGGLGIGTINPDGSMLRVDGDVGISGELKVNGKVGINRNTEAVNAMLHIDGDGNSATDVLLQLEFDSSPADHGLRLTDQGGSTKSQFTMNSADTTDTWIQASADIRFFTATNFNITAPTNERMVILSDGKVGIGTKNPSTMLDVHNGDIELQAGYDIRWTNGNNRIRYYSSALQFDVNGSSRMWITDDGNVGIGTLIPSGRLHVNNAGTGIIVANEHITGNAFEVHGAQGNLFTITDDLSDSLMSVNDAAGMPVFEVFADDTIKSYRNNETKFEVDPDNNRIRLRDNLYVSGRAIITGSVGIGTSSPDGKFEVRVASEDGNSSTHGIRIGTASNAVNIGASDSNYAWLQVRDADHLALQPNGGKVGIGVVSPQSLLSVNGDVQITGDLHIGNGKNIYHYGSDTDTYISFDSDEISLFAGGHNLFEIDEDVGEVVINEAGRDIDLRVESDSNTKALFVRGSDARVGIGTTAPSEELDIVGELRIRTIGSTAVDASTKFLVEDGSNKVQYITTTNTLSHSDTGTNLVTISSTVNAVQSTTQLNLASLHAS